MSEGSDSDGRFESLLGGGAVLFVGLVVQLGVGFVAKLVIARYLGRLNYGAVSIGVTVMTTASVVVLLGLDTGIGRYLPRQDGRDDRRGVLVSAFGIAVPIALLAGGSIAVSAGLLASTVFDDPSLESVLRVFGLAVPLMVLVRLTVGTIRGRQESKPRVYLQNLALPLLRFGLIAVAVALGLGAVGVAGAYLVAYAVVGAGALLYLSRRTALFEGTDATPMRRELLRFSTPLMIVSTMNMVHSNLDVFVLGYFHSTGVVATYTAAYPLATLLTVVLTAFGFLFMPTISELHAEGRGTEARRTYQIVSKWVLLASLPLFLVFVTYPDIVVRYTFGSEFADGAAALAILAVGFFTHAIAGPSGNALTATGRTRLVMIDNTVVAATNVGLNLLLVPRYSLLGAAVATTVGYALMNGLYVTQLYRSIGVHPFRRTVVAPTVGAVAVWGLLTWVVDAAVEVTLPVVLLVSVVFGVVYLGLVPLLGGVEAEEVALVSSAEERTGLDLTRLRGVVERFGN